MPVTATFGLTTPGGTPTPIGLQPTILQPIPSEMDGKRNGGVVQHGYNWFVAEFTTGFDGETFITQAEAAFVTTAWVTATGTDGRRAVTFFDMYAASGAGADVTRNAIMDQPEYQLGLWGLFRGVRVLFRDVRPQ